MSQITSLYVYKVIGQASADVPTRDLLENLGLDPDASPDPARMVGSEAYYDFFAELSKRDPDGLQLPLRIGASMKSDEYGAFGLAWKSAPNLRGSFARSERYGRVLGSAETYSIQSVGHDLFFQLDKAGEGQLGMTLSNEASLSAVTTICQEVCTADFKPRAVHFKHEPRGDIAVYESHFKCPVVFHSGRDALLVDADMIDAPNKLGDETIARFFDRHLEQELASLSNEADFEQQVRRTIGNLLSEGVPALSLIASELGLGARTLQRRLSDLGLSFQNVVDMARKDLAEQLLKDTDYSLAEIAFLTGFAEQSGFTRAFKRWAGQTPRSYRLSISNR